MMSTRSLAILGMISALAVGWNESARAADVTRNFETNSLTGLRVHGNAPTVQSSIKRVGKYGMRTYLNRYTSSVPYRTEVRVLAPDPDVNQDSWYAFSIYLPADYVPDNVWEIVAQTGGIGQRERLDVEDVLAADAAADDAAGHEEGRHRREVGEQADDQGCGIQRPARSCRARSASVLVAEHAPMRLGVAGRLCPIARRPSSARAIGRGPAPGIGDRAPSRSTKATSRRGSSRRAACVPPRSAQPRLLPMPPGPDEGHQRASVAGIEVDADASHVVLAADRRRCTATGTAPGRRRVQRSRRLRRAWLGRSVRRGGSRGRSVERARELLRHRGTDVRGRVVAPGSGRAAALSSGSVCAVGLLDVDELRHVGRPSSWYSSSSPETVLARRDPAVAARQ